MCGRYVIISTVEEYEKKFQATAKIPWQANYNVAAGQKAPVITAEKPQEIQAYYFGFTPSWSKKRTWVINARSEGDHNKENDPNFTGSKGILKKPFFRKAIRSQRCLVLADAFIEGTTKEKLQKPYLVYMRNKNRPFALAGIYDEWVNQESGEVFPTFAIITCPPNALLQKIPHHRMPVVVPEGQYRRYLNPETDLSEITAMLSPFPAKEMNAYPIDSAISKVKTNQKEALQPIGPPLMKEVGLQQKQRVELFGMGENRKLKN
ncbi:MAG: SOS response-associated peptidase [Vicingaceae bacterium]